MNGKIQSFNFDGTVRNFEPCFNGTEPECGEELYTGKIQHFLVTHFSLYYFFSVLAHCALDN